MYLEFMFVQILNPSSPMNLSTLFGERNNNLLQNSCLENSTDRGVPYSLRGHKELDMTEGLTLSLSLCARVWVYRAYATKLLQLCPTLCNPVDCM